MRVYRPGKTDDGVVMPSIFLAGPSSRDREVTDWREHAVSHFAGKSIYLYAPEPFCGDYEKQVEWETYHLRRASVIAFWIPRNLESLPGFTTNIEFGEYLRSGKIVLGYPEGAPKMRYLDIRARKHGVPIFHTLEETLDFAYQLAKPPTLYQVVRTESGVTLLKVEDSDNHTDYSYWDYHGWNRCLIPGLGSVIFQTPTLSKFNEFLIELGAPEVTA